MLVIARIADYEISEAEIALEMRSVADSPQLRVEILSRLIDSYLLFQEAKSQGFDANEDEFEEVFLTTLDELDDGTQHLDVSQAKSLERKVTRQIVISKYIHLLCEDSITIDEDKLYAFYQDQKDSFQAPLMVRASHILVKQSREKAEQVRANLKTAADFLKACSSCSDCPTQARCGDLGFFQKGQMIAEIDEVAFNMKVGEISPVFESIHGFHILMLTERKQPVTIPFEEIKESLRLRLITLEREFYLLKHIKDLREKYHSLIQILDEQYSQAL